MVQWYNGTMVQNHLKSLPSFFIDPCYRTIYKMVQFYETYSAGSFIELVKQYGMQHFLPGNSGMKLPSNENTIVPFELAQIDSNEFVHKGDSPLCVHGTDDNCLSCFWMYFFLN